MDRYQETFETWNKVAPLYEEKFMKLDLYNDTYDQFCELLPMKNPVILEIGCGPGNITQYLLNKRPDFKILATDIAPNMIALAKINCPTAQFEIMDSRNISSIKNKYDGLVCGFCLPYLSDSDVEKLISDSQVLLNKDAILYFSFVAGEKEQSGYQSSRNGDRTYFYYHNIDTISDHLKRNSFAIIDIIQKKYIKTDHTEEWHTILLAKNTI